MKKVVLLIAVLGLAGCLLGKDEEKKPGYNNLTLTGELEGLFVSMGSFYSWYLPIDSIFADYPHMWDQETYGVPPGTCWAYGYLGNSDTTDYTNQYMNPNYLGPSAVFTAPQDTVHSRALNGREFTRYRLEITCADSIPVPPQ